jgi:poly(3-hydroxybutyrate) depolymerase
MNRHSFILVVFVFSVLAVSLAQASGFGGKPTDSFKVAGVMRYYSVHAPGGLGSNPPLVFTIHGYNIDGPLMEAITQMDKVADRDKFIIVYPSALNKSWNMTTGGDDLTFIVAIIDTIDARYHINRNRIYVTGFSQGGFMSFLLGCKYSDIFAAIAPVSGLLNGTCTLKRPVPLFLKFGTKDVATPASFMSSVNSWLKLDSCPSTPVVTRPYPSSNPKSKVTRLYYGPCARGSEVVVDTVAGGTHDWVLNADTNVNTSEEVWAFLKNFTLNGNTGVTGKESSAAQHEAVSVCYFSGIVRLRGAGEKSMARILDTRGRLVASKAVTQSRFVLDNKPGGGVYVVMVNTRNGPVAVRMVIP